MFSEKGHGVTGRETVAQRGEQPKKASPTETAPARSAEKKRRNPEEERRRAFQELRLKTHAEMELEVVERLKDNPEPTEEEILAGTFREEIEPQVRDAVFELRRKGYSCASSGFGGESGEVQAIDGYFDIDEKTKNKLKELGATVEPSNLGEGYTIISLRPSSPDLTAMKDVWNRIAEIIPDKGKPAEPSISGGAEDFRNQYASGRTDVEKEVLKLRLARESLHPDVERKMRNRLEELGG